MTSLQKLAFYATPPHKCNYLPDRQAVTLFADPKFPKNMQLYSALVNCGFRRSGPHLYVPHCGNCTSCISVRIPVRDFMPTRSQRRAWQRNRDLIITQLPSGFRREHFELYKKYLDARHPEGGMENPTPDVYMDFLTAPWADTVFFEMRSSGRLIAVAVTDIMADALSAVYTFYDPADAARSPGKFAILFQIEQAKLMGLTWLYLGYWIERCEKMKYKSEYQPQQIFQNNMWVAFPGALAQESALPPDKNQAKSAL